MFLFEAFNFSAVTKGKPSKHAAESGGRHQPTTRICIRTDKHGRWKENKKKKKKQVTSAASAEEEGEGEGGEAKIPLHYFKIQIWKRGFLPSYPPFRAYVRGKKGGKLFIFA